MFHLSFQPSTLGRRLSPSPSSCCKSVFFGLHRILLILHHPQRVSRYGVPLSYNHQFSCAKNRTQGNR